jgi:predicted amidohydrolase
MTFARRLRTKNAGWVVAVAAFSFSAYAAEVSPPSPAATSLSFKTRADSPPRKVVVASAIANFSGSLDERLTLAARLIDEAATTAAKSAHSHGLDLVVLPEFAFCREDGKTAATRAIALDDAAVTSLGEKAREHRTWIVAPMTLRESAAVGRISNAAVLLNRSGKVAGIFRKVHPMADPDGTFEGGVTPGDAYPVFPCDFGRLGILICWDMGYEEAWDALAAAGAEIVALPTASPQTLRPSAEALRHHYYVVNSAPRDNASIFDPIGRTIAQQTNAPGMVVHEIDLAYAILHWVENLQEGRILRDRFGSRVGGEYSSREDTGVFWSNDPQMSIGAMIREFGLPEMPADIERMERARQAFRSR